MLFMAIERFKASGAAAVYQRFGEQGRMMPDGLKYVGSWVGADLGRCFQLVECDNPRLIQEWVDCWADLVDFEIVAVITSAEAVEKISPLVSERLGREVS
jgi:hypothetical protein